VCMLFFYIVDGVFIFKSHYIIITDKIKFNKKFHNNNNKNAHKKYRIKKKKDVIKIK
jgi:hypothetical protein